MAVIKIEGIPPWDGSYPFDITFFTNRELHDIKLIADVRAGELEDEFRRGNNDLIVAVAAIALKRNGKLVPIDDLWDAATGRIMLEDDPAPVGAADPLSMPAPEHGSNGDAGLPSVSSGPSSNDTGDGLPETTPVFTGIPGSDTGAV